MINKRNMMYKKYVFSVFNTDWMFTTWHSCPQWKDINFQHETLLLKKLFGFIVAPQMNLKKTF